VGNHLASEAGIGGESGERGAHGTLATVVDLIGGPVQLDGVPGVSEGAGHLASRGNVVGGEGCEDAIRVCLVYLRRDGTQQGLAGAQRVNRVGS